MLRNENENLITSITECHTEQQFVDYMSDNKEQDVTFYFDKFNT